MRACATAHNPRLPLATVALDARANGETKRHTILLADLDAHGLSAGCSQQPARQPASARDLCRRRPAQLFCGAVLAGWRVSMEHCSSVWSTVLPGCEHRSCSKGGSNARMGAGHPITVLPPCDHRALVGAPSEHRSHDRASMGAPCSCHASTAADLAVLAGRALMATPCRRCHGFPGRAPVQPERASHGASDALGARPGKPWQRLDRP